ncbi:MAG: DUF29 family protein [Stellaceae bacterium]
MPDELRHPTREDDPYAWALAQARLLAKGESSLKNLDLKQLQHFLEEAAEDMLAAVRSHLVNLMAHAAKAAYSSNPDIVGHWRSECVEFHDRLIAEYRPSMRRAIDIEKLWRRATRKVLASFADYGEPRPDLPESCPFTLAELVAEELDVEPLVAAVGRR